MAQRRTVAVHSSIQRSRLAAIVAASMVSGVAGTFAYFVKTSGSGVPCDDREHEHLERDVRLDRAARA